MLDFFKQRISHSPLGHITYADFIEAALYHPKQGYYMRDSVKIGREGDFYTTSNISDIYGRMVAKWYSNLVTEFGLPAHICEIGAGTGRFAKAFIEEWKKRMSVPLSYILVETSPYHRKVQKENLTAFWDTNVKQVETLEEIKPFDGLIFSNELFDALPVHIIQKINNDLHEVVVTFQGDRLTEKWIPLEDEQILNFIMEQHIVLRESQRIEIPMAMISLIHSLSKLVRKGIFVTVDYGYTREEWMQPSRNEGSLRGFYRHQLIDNILLNPGEMDITSHVHFDALIDEGEKAGLSYVQKLRQDEFFLSIGILEELQENYDPNPFSETSKRNRAIRSLIMPNGMSPFFHVVLQHKGLEDIASKFIKKI